MIRSWPKPNASHREMIHLHFSLPRYRLTKVAVLSTWALLGLAALLDPRSPGAALRSGFIVLAAYINFGVLVLSGLAVVLVEFVLGYHFEPVTRAWAAFVLMALFCPIQWIFVERELIRRYGNEPSREAREGDAPDRL